MKKLNILFLLLVSVSLTFLTSCEDPDKIYFQQDAITVAGAYLRHLEIPVNTFSIADIPGSSFEATFEAHDSTSETSLFSSIDVFVSHQSNPEEEVLLTSIAVSEFTRNDLGYPELAFSSPASAAIAALNYTVNEDSFNTRIKYRIVMNLSDGTSYTEGAVSSEALGQVFFDSPFFYSGTFTN